MHRFSRVKGTTLVLWNLSIVVTVNISHLLIVATTLGRRVVLILQLYKMTSRKYAGPMVAIMDRFQFTI